MISIKNKEQEDCQVQLIDVRGRIYYETQMKPNAKLEIDLKALARGIYMLIFCTTNTSFVQQVIKY